ncbi:MAG: hypothetical protein AAF702_28055 [Chloroflexota bacterium]
MAYTPVVSIVEAKNENIVSGIGQCIAEMYAAQLFNKSADHPLPATYGAITTGDQWRFIKLVDLVTYIDRTSYYINEINKIVAIVVHMASVDE